MKKHSHQQIDLHLCYESETCPSLCVYYESDLLMKPYLHVAIQPLSLHFMNRVERSLVLKVTASFLLID